jgi:hypothetical protein
MGAPVTTEPGTSIDPAAPPAAQPPAAVVTLETLDAKLTALIAHQAGDFSKILALASVLKGDVAAAPSKVKAFAAKVGSGASAVVADVKSNWLLVLVAVGVIAVAVEINIELIKGLVSKF